MRRRTRSRLSVTRLSVETLSHGVYPRGTALENQWSGTMLTRAFILAGAFTVLGTMVLATSDKPTSKVGDLIEVTLTGDLAQQFVERTVPPKAGKLPDGL